MDDRGIARKSLDLQSRGRDYALVTIPVYMAWSKRKLNGGVSEALIDHMDAMSMFLRPEEVEGVTEAELDDLLEDVRLEVER